MSHEEEFAEAIRRIRRGDQQAAAELVRKYEPFIRREVRLHLEDKNLRQVFDSMDVAQSVLASFFIRTATGEYDLDRPEQLVGLLARMTRNKLSSAVRKQYRYRRDALNMPEADARAAMEGIWRPGGAWAGIIGDDGARALPHRFAGRDY